MLSKFLYKTCYYVINQLIEYIDKNVYYKL